MIRKRQIQKILTRLQSEKPYWLADTFSEFCDYPLMTQSNAMLGKVRSNLAKFQKPTEPLFSIIVPIYNVEKYLNEAIDSVLQQDFYNYELILVNDGSTDSSGDIAYQYNKKYPHIQFISQPNGGLSAARNTGMKLAKGDYLMFLDSDDYWRGTTILSDIAKLIEENHQPDFVLSSLMSVYPDKKTISHLIKVENITDHFTNDFTKLVHHGFYRGFACTKTVKRSLIQSKQLYFPEGKYYEDVLWSFVLAKNVSSYVNYHSDFYMYRREREGAITQYISKEKVRDLFYLFDACFNELFLMTEKNNIYLGLKEYLENYAQYVETCYQLLNQENKTALENQFIQFQQNKNQLTQDENITQ